MVILFDSPSQLSRLTIAEKAVADRPTWHHLALEVVEKATPDSEEASFHLELVKRCSAELATENMHLLLSLASDAPQYASLAEALTPGGCTTVHLGDGGDQGSFDHVMDARETSVQEAVATLRKLMDAAT
jgi:uncharacterized protein YgfB (UPF0149 family)